MNSVKRVKVKSERIFISSNQPSNRESLRPTDRVKPWFKLDLAEITRPQLNREEGSSLEP